jgi:chemotaxis protein MotB
MASNQPIIVKKIKKVAGGHHGGAWKVAYADFVTAMMAFFLLMWLINTTSPEQKRGIADYFAPAAISLSTSGSGGALGGTSLSSEGVRSSGSNAIDPTLSPYTPKSIASAQQSEKAGTSSPDVQYDDISEDALNKAMAIRERAEFEKAEESLRQAMQSMPDLAELSKHLIIDQTPEGLRIQIVDQDGRSMFAPGSSEPLPRTQRMLEAVAGIVSQLPNRITVSGHTDDTPAGNSAYSNWELSADRANASRRILQRAGLDPDRIAQVSGKASSEPLYPDDPNLPANRRISIVLLREAPVLPRGHGL